jgi:hypothetical protein
MITPNETEKLRRELLDLDIKHPPDYWERILDIQIIDEDGWRGPGSLAWEIPISREEFLNRAANSTTQWPKDFFKRTAV